MNHDLGDDPDGDIEGYDGAIVSTSGPGGEPVIAVDPAPTGSELADKLRDLADEMEPGGQLHAIAGLGGAATNPADAAELRQVADLLERMHTQGNPEAATDQPADATSD